MQNVEIQYPVAFDDHGNLVKIEDAPRQHGLRYTCVHCGEPMSAVVRVTQREPHFRHTKSVVCDPDLTLHSTAIAIIRKAHNEAQSNRTPYRLTRPCEAKISIEYGVKPCINMATEIDLADGWQSETEKSVVEGTRSDLTFSHDDGRQIIIEVVNTHSMEPETETAYRKSGIPLVVVNVDWLTVNDLSGGIHTEETLNFASNECGGCESERLEAEADLERRRVVSEAVFKQRCEGADHELAKMRRQRRPRAQFRPFYKVKPHGARRPTSMFPKTQCKVFANAIILTELGFVQSNPDNKPWLFAKTIRGTPDVTLYADFSGTDEIPIYQNTAASLYTSLRWTPIRDLKANAYIVEKFGERLQNAGVQVRTSFHTQFPFESIDVNPVSRVNREDLNRMLRYSEREMCSNTHDRACFNPDRCRESGCYFVNRHKKREMHKPYVTSVERLCMECGEYFPSELGQCPKCR